MIEREFVRGVWLRLVFLAVVVPMLAPAESSPLASDLVEAGRALFFETRLSADGMVSCASCHRPERAFGDTSARSKGVDGRTAARNTPSLENLRFQAAHSWDGRHTSLEAQVLDPLLNPLEHGLRDAGELVARVRQLPAVAKKLGQRDVTAEQISRALAAFVLSIPPARSRLDRFMQGEPDALTVEEKRGLEIFRGAAQCADCHRIEAPKPSLADGDYHAVFLAPLQRADLGRLVAIARSMSAEQRTESVGRDSEIAALGRYNVTLDPRDIGKYRTPSLRNVAATAPYMHDGSVETLEAAVELELYYRNSSRDRPLLLTPEQKADLISFLKSLSAEPRHVQ